MLGRYGQTVYGMYDTNPEDAGTGTILACLLGCYNNWHETGMYKLIRSKFIHIHRLCTEMSPYYQNLFHKTGTNLNYRPTLQ